MTTTTVALPWYAFRRRYHCPHPYIRGIYGDEINFTPGFRRLQCRRCGRFLDGPVILATSHPAEQKPYNVEDFLR